MNTTTDKKKQDNYELFCNTIKSLSYSQGFYGRLLNSLVNMNEDERLELINNLPTFNDAVDVVMWLEQ